MDPGAKAAHMADEHPVGAPDAAEPDLRPHPLEMPPYGVVPEGDTLGARHIAVALQDLPFPMTGRELLARAGRWRIPVTGIHMHPLADFLEGVPLDHRFRSAWDVARAVEKARRRG